MTFGTKHQDRVTAENINLRPEEAVGKSGQAQLTYSLNGTAHVSLMLANEDEHRVRTTHTTNLRDEAGRKLERVAFTLKPSAPDGKPFTVVLTRNNGATSIADRWDVDFGEHPKASEWNKKGGMGASVTLGRCTVESIEYSPPLAIETPAPYDNILGRPGRGPSTSAGRG
jgi:hypothetical protein